MKRASQLQTNKGSILALCTPLPVPHTYTAHPLIQAWHRGHSTSCEQGFASFPHKKSSASIPQPTNCIALRFSPPLPFSGQIPRSITSQLTLHSLRPAAVNQSCSQLSTQKSFPSLTFRAAPHPAEAAQRMEQHTALLARHT